VCGRFTLTNLRRAIGLFDGIAAPADLKPQPIRPETPSASNC
jgi:hypothetical protein